MNSYNPILINQLDIADLEKLVTAANTYELDEARKFIKGENYGTEFPFDLCQVAGELITACSLSGLECSFSISTPASQCQLMIWRDKTATR